MMKKTVNTLLVASFLCLPSISPTIDFILLCFLNVSFVKIIHLPTFTISIQHCIVTFFNRFFSNTPELVCFCFLDNPNLSDFFSNLMMFSYRSQINVGCVMNNRTRENLKESQLTKHVYRVVHYYEIILMDIAELVVIMFIGILMV